METKVNTPKTLVPCVPQHFAICDESRAIAAEYEDGLSSYPEIKQQSTIDVYSTPPATNQTPGAFNQSEYLQVTQQPR